MNLKFRKRALNTLAHIIDWIDEQNTVGAGNRWLAKTFDCRKLQKPK
jgi:hypothetical protein